jgi:glycosyltransferase involved in cell wall biosynthesis
LISQSRGLGDVYKRQQVTVPNEFQRVGKFNIGVTAGIETTLCDPSWIEGCNRMDLILASSNHAKSVFEATEYSQLNEQKQVVGSLKLQKPVEVLFEGIRLDKFKKSYAASPAVESLFKDVKEDFAYLFVGHWLPGAFGEDRKNVSGLIKSFYEAFKNKQNAPALILKTSGGSLSIVDRDQLIDKINQIKSTVDSKNLPNVYIAYGDFSYEEMNDLYNHTKVKAHISFTRGEGFGRPLLEAALTSKPIITTNWSGHVDFLDEESSILLGGTLTNVHPSASWKGVLNEEASWFTVDYGQAIGFMKDMFKNYKTYTEKSRKTYHHIKTNFSFDAMQTKLDSILEARIPEFPKQVGLVLPKLKKVGEPKLASEPKKLSLPKLKKVE